MGCEEKSQIRPGNHIPEELSLERNILVLLNQQGFKGTLVLTMQEKFRANVSGAWEL